MRSPSCFATAGLRAFPDAPEVEDESERSLAVEHGIEFNAAFCGNHDPSRSRHLKIGRRWSRCPTNRVRQPKGDE